MAAKSSQWRPGPTVCRCCLAEGCYKDISTEYFWMGKREVYSDMLSDTFDVSISFSQSGGPNSNSRLICEPCISRLRDATEFKKQVQECEKTFMQHLSGVEIAEIEIDPVQKVKIESIKEEKILSDDDGGIDDDDDLFLDKTDFGADDDDDDDDLDDEPLTRLATKVPKKESEADLIDILEQTKSKVAEKRKSTTKTKSTPTKKAKTSKQTVKPSVSQSSKKGECPDDEASWANTYELIEKTTLCPFTVGRQNTVKCYYCTMSFKQPTAFRNHVLSEHSADRKKHRKNVLRVDIGSLKCMYCLTDFDSLELISVHLIDEHKVKMSASARHNLVPIKLEVDKYICSVCGKKFTGLTELSRHTGKHYTKHDCAMCGKKFETQVGLLKHIEIKHTERGDHYCTICRNHFPTLESKKEHVRENYKCMPFKCTICEARFLVWERKEEHLVEVHGKKKKTFPCTECGRVFENRNLYYFHFKEAHTDDFKCPVCGKTFRTKSTLTEHTYIHTGERPYKCEHCDKTFNRAKSLKDHKSVHDEAQKVSCPDCQKILVGKIKFRYHMGKHHPETFAQM